jgi:glycosyltransferase involved in cell wall biosynthesis
MTLGGAKARVALTVTGNPLDPAGYSGAPASLARAFTELALEVTPVSTELPQPWARTVTNMLALGYTSPRSYVRARAAKRPLRLAVRDNKPKLLASREMNLIRSHTVRRRLAGLRPQRVIQFGSEYMLPAGTDYVTLDDATIVQLASSYPYEWMQSVPPMMLGKMIARQRLIFRRARACCVLNSWAAESAIRDYGVDPRRVHVVGAGTNRRIVAAPRSWERPVFLFVGKDFERKNGHGVLRAFAEVRTKHPSAELHVVGGHPRIDQSGVRGYGPLRLGRPDESALLNRLFAHATCLVMPSWLEPTGYVHAEALAAGIGSIGTRAGGVDTLIGDAGVTVRPGDDEELVREMSRFCDPAVMAQYGALASRRAPLLTWRRVAERVVRAIDLPGTDLRDLATFL